MFLLDLKELIPILIELEASRGDENFYFTLTKEELLELIRKLPDDKVIKAKLRAK